MPLVVVGIDHRSAPAEVFHRATIPADDLGSVLDRAIKSDHISEAVLVATCLRTEIYVDAVRFHGAVADLRGVFSHFTGLGQDDLSPYLVDRYEEAACSHLFSLAAGVESAMIGEGEVLGQLGRAWQASRQHGTCRTVLNGLFRHALVAGKRARNETQVGAGVSSIGTAAVALAGERAEGLSDKSVLVIGAGDVATKVALAARRAGAAKLSVANRTHEKAVDLAARVEGEVVLLSDGFDDHDVVITATGATEPIIDVGAVHEHQVLVDLGVPGDVDRAVAQRLDVVLLGLDDVQSFVNSQRSNRVAEIEHVQAIVEEEVVRYFADVNSRVVAPIVQALHARAYAIRNAELARYSSKLSSLDDSQRRVVEELTNSLMAKLFHDPSVNLKMSAGTPDGERMAEAALRLFDL